MASGRNGLREAVKKGEGKTNQLLKQNRRLKRKLAERNQIIAKLSADLFVAQEKISFHEKTKKRYAQIILSCNQKRRAQEEENQELKEICRQLRGPLRKS